MRSQKIHPLVRFVAVVLAVCLVAEPAAAAGWREACIAMPLAGRMQKMDIFTNQAIPAAFWRMIQPFSPRTTSAANRQVARGALLNYPTTLVNPAFSDKRISLKIVRSESGKALAVVAPPDAGLQDHPLLVHYLPLAF